MSNRYRDIISLPRHVSETRAPMPAKNRAAQFAPFAALTGFDGYIGETGRTNLERYERETDKFDFLFDREWG